MSQQEDIPRARKRRYDGAVILPIFAALLIFPPFIKLFAAPVTVFGVPLIVVWLFGLWLALIIVARHLAHLLTQSGDE